MKKNNTCKNWDDSSPSGRTKRPGEREEDFLDREAMHLRMCRINHKILVLSGKRGVGKSTVAVKDVAGKDDAGKSEKKRVSEDGGPMRIAIPVTGGVLSSHFGHCERFVLFDVGDDGKTVGKRQEITPPPHEPGTFPKWLHEQGATVIIAGGMGSRAQSLFEQNNIEVVVGAGCEAPDAIVKSFLEGRLETGSNLCDH